MGAALTLAACFAAAAVLHPVRTAPSEQDQSWYSSTELHQMDVHWQSGASLGADIPMTAANCTSTAKPPFLSKSVSRESYVSKSRVLKIWNLRSAARDLYQSSHTCSHTRLIRDVSLAHDNL